MVTRLVIKKTLFSEPGKIDSPTAKKRNSPLILSGECGKSFGRKGRLAIAIFPFFAPAIRRRTFRPTLAAWTFRRAAEFAAISVARPTVTITWRAAIGSAVTIARRAAIGSAVAARRRGPHRRTRTRAILLQGADLAQDLIELALQVIEPRFNAARRGAAKVRTTWPTFAIAARRRSLRPASVAVATIVHAAVAIATIFWSAITVAPIIIPPLAARRAFATSAFPRRVVGQQIVSCRTSYTRDKQAEKKP
jgi:hypothetical protein